MTMTASESSSPAVQVADVLAETEKLVKSLTTEQKALPGIQHLIVDASATGGQDQFLVCSGVLDKLDSAVNVDPSTQFMAYSCTKIITAIAIFQLCQQGKLKFEDSLTQHFPNHPYDNNNDSESGVVTIGTLLNHTSGVPSPIPTDWFIVADEDTQSGMDRDKLLQDMLTKHNRLQFQPGTRGKRLYTNLGYWLLEKCIENASAMSYAEYIQQHIFDPLQIPKDQATFELPMSSQKLATGHIPKWSLTNGIFYLLSPKHYWIQPATAKNADKSWSRFAKLQHIGLGYGGLYCTATALGIILKDLLQQDSSILLNAKMKTKMLEPTTTTDDTNKINSLAGWVIGKLHGVEYYCKQGGGFGFHGNIRLYPSLDIATVFLANSTEISEGPIDARANYLDNSIVNAKKKKQEGQ